MSTGPSGQEPVLSEDRGSLRILTLNRPAQLNAADLGLQRRLLELVVEAEATEGLGALILTGAGSAFCSGGDLSLVRALAEGAPELQAELGRINAELLERLLSLEIPALAAVNGLAIGFGAALVALCDLVVMAEDAYLCEPHVRYGLAASPAIELIWPSLTSRAVAKELTMTGRRVGAQEAVRLGLANRVVASGQALEETIRLAEELVAFPREGVAAVKAQFNAELLGRLGRGGQTQP